MHILYRIEFTTTTNSTRLDSLAALIYVHWGLSELNFTNE